MTGRELRVLAGLTAHHAGWLAFDADRDDDARRWWLESLHWSRLTDDDGTVSVATLAMMTYQAIDRGRSAEASDLAVAAREGVKRASTPRLTSVLLTHEAAGHASQGDTQRALGALRRARGLAEQERHDDDPSWLNFYGAASFASKERLVALLLGDTAAAERAARAALALSDPVAYPRNRSLYLIRLADVLVRRREVDEAATLATQAATAAARMDSGRARRGVGALARSLAPFGYDVAVAA